MEERNTKGFSEFVPVSRAVMEKRLFHTRIFGFDSVGKEREK